MGTTRHPGDGETSGTPAVCFGRHQLDPTQGLTRGEQEVRLTPKSLSVLRILADRAGRIVTREELFRGPWKNASAR